MLATINTAAAAATASPARVLKRKITSPYFDAPTQPYCEEQDQDEYAEAAFRVLVDASVLETQEFTRPLKRRKTEPYTTPIPPPVEMLTPRHDEQEQDEYDERYASLDFNFEEYFEKKMAQINELKEKQRMEREITIHTTLDEAHRIVLSVGKDINAWGMSGEYACHKCERFIYGVSFFFTRLARIGTLI